MAEQIDTKAALPVRKRNYVFLQSKENSRQPRQACKPCAAVWTVHQKNRSNIG